MDIIISIQYSKDLGSPTCHFDFRYLKILFSFFILYWKIVDVLLEYSYFTLLCWFLLGSVNQLCVHIYSFPLEPPFHSPLSHSSGSSQRVEPSNPCCTEAFHLCLFYTQYCRCVSPALQCVSPSSFSHSRCGHVSILICICIPAQQIGSSVGT